MLLGRPLSTSFHSPQPPHAPRHRDSSGTQVCSKQLLAALCRLAFHTESPCLHSTVCSDSHPLPFCREAGYSVVRLIHLITQMGHRHWHRSVCILPNFVPHLQILLKAHLHRFFIQQCESHRVCRSEMCVSAESMQTSACFPVSSLEVCFLDLCPPPSVSLRT